MNMNDTGEKLKLTKNDMIHKTLKSRQTKQHIIMAYLALIRSKKWDKISVIEICKKAEITRGTFYQYFGDIFDLMEQLEGDLLEDLKERYAHCLPVHGRIVTREKFPDQFDYSPPEIFLVWFGFCREHREAMLSLLDRKYGDSYFVKKLKVILREKLEEMMDSDGHARDELRVHFVEVFVELHLLSAQSWLAPETDDYLSVEDIVNLLNTMRVGAGYLHWKNAMDSDYKDKMKQACGKDMQIEQIL